MIHTVRKDFVASVQLVILVVDVKHVRVRSIFIVDKFVHTFLVLNCLDAGEECLNGGTCMQRPIGDYVCSCPYPYCGLRCQSQKPNCGTLIKRTF